MNVDFLSCSNKKNNEDIAGSSKCAYWVIDGATGYFNNFIDLQTSDALWYVKGLNDYLKENMDDAKRSIVQILKDAIEQLAVRYFAFIADKEESVLPEQYPSATIAIARERGDAMELFVLCDCTVAVSVNHQVSVYTDSRIDKIEKQLIEKMHAYQEEHRGCTIEDVRRILKKDFISNRQRKNTPEGYYVLEFNKDAVEQGIQVSLPKASVDGLLLMSDGFTRVVDVFHCFDDFGSLFKEAKENGLRGIWEKINQCENDDPDCIRFPRTKKSDDSTAVLVTEKPM